MRLKPFKLLFFCAKWYKKFESASAYKLKRWFTASFGVPALVAGTHAKQQVNIGISTPDASALLERCTTDDGLLLCGPVLRLPAGTRGRQQVNWLRL